MRNREVGGGIIEGEGGEEKHDAGWGHERG
jgi:hypothetical protein